MSAAALLAGFAADGLLGDPRRGHPVAVFGTIAQRVEDCCYRPSKMVGAVTCGGLVAAAAGVGEALARWVGRPVALAAVTWAALGGRSLGAEATRIGRHLDRGDLDAARAALPALVGRDPSRLDADGVARAVVESVAENTSDAVTGALFWGALAGPAGVAAFRAANTLDAMVGHRSARYADYGWAAARLDDLAGWPGARLTVALTALLGGAPRRTVAVARTDGPRHPSPNAGPVEAAFAGALGLELGGPLAYGTRHEDRPRLGAGGRTPQPHDIARAVRLSRRVGLAAALLCALGRTRR